MQAAGEYVEQNFEEESTVLVGSSGYFGRYAPSMLVIDGLGLFSREIVEDKKSGKFTEASDLIQWDIWVCTNFDPLCIEARKHHDVVAEFGTQVVLDRRTNR